MQGDWSVSRRYERGRSVDLRGLHGCFISKYPIKYDADTYRAERETAQTRLPAGTHEDRGRRTGQMLVARAFK